MAEFKTNLSRREGILLLTIAVLSALACATSFYVGYQSNAVVLSAQQGEAVLQEAPVIGWRLTVEEFAPLVLQRADRRGLQGGQLGQKGIRHSNAPSSVRALA